MPHRLWSWYHDTLVAYRRRTARTAMMGTRCVIDAESAEDAVALVRRVCRENESADELMTRLVALFATFLPNERSLEQLSIEQRRLSGRGDANEYCCYLVYTAMTVAVCERYIPPRHNRCVCDDCGPMRAVPAPVSAPFFPERESQTEQRV